MKIFEFHFNPNHQEDLIFDSFCYEPSSYKEKKLGSLYIVGELKNAIPQNSRLISNLALLLKREYYAASSPEQGIKKALKKANDFLSDRTKTGNVSWLGNLSLTVISLHNFDLNFSKDGNIKMLLLRPGQITDIGRNFEIEEFEPYPLKIFTNIVNGRFLENDKVLILTNQVFEIFSKNGLLEKLSLIQDQKGLKEFFRSREKDFVEASGICFLLFLSKENLPKSVLTVSRAISPISLKEIIAPLVRVFSNGLNWIKKIFWGKKKSWPKLNFKMPKISLSKKAKPKKVMDFSGFKELALRIKNYFDFKDKKTKKNLLLIFFLLLLIMIGFLFSKREAEIKLANFRNQLISVQEKILQAQGYSSLNQNSQADSLFKEAFKDVLILIKNNSPVQEQANTLKDLIEKNLNELNKVEDIAEPKLILNFSDTGFSPQRLVLFNDFLYFFSPFQKGIIKLSGQDLEKIDIDKSFSLVASLGNDLAFFTKPDQISIFDGSQIIETVTLELLGQNAFISMASFKDNLYFLEKDSGRVVKYKQPFLENADSPSYWIKTKESKPLGAESIKVTGLVYILAKDNTIWRYLDGSFDKSIELSFFPFVNNLMKLVYSPSFPGFAVLEPVEKRIILIDNQGLLIKQFRSDKFINLKDAVFSSDGKSIYVLSGSEVYEVSF
ncbi:hypothetical protein L6250_02300 [Candidatus Parcubacteria bacterium]|nr:hypothetical protein [Candidatus Parcubacteria bacterium]